MEKKAVELGIFGQIFYLFPNSSGVDHDDYLQIEELHLGTRAAVDISQEATNALDIAEQNFQTIPTWGNMNLETNCGDHTLLRALQEASELFAFFNNTDPRILGRTASFCFERSGYNEAGFSDQVWL